MGRRIPSRTGPSDKRPDDPGIELEGVTDMAAVDTGSLPPKKLKKIKKKKVPTVVQDFIKEGYTRVGCIRKAKDNWTVAAKS